MPLGKSVKLLREFVGFARELEHAPGHVVGAVAGAVLGGALGDDGVVVAGEVDAVAADHEDGLDATVFIGG